MTVRSEKCGTLAPYAVAYFVMVWIGKVERREVLRTHIVEPAKRIYGEPEFFYYALADGIQGGAGAPLLILERYKSRTGNYPKRVLVDLVYRTKENRAFCEERGIEMQKRRPGRKPKDAKERRKLEKKERKNDADRIEVERFFSVEKRCCGAGLIMTKLSKTTLGSIALSVLVANLFGVQLPLLFFVLFHGRGRWEDGLSHAGNRGRCGMTGAVGDIYGRRVVATLRETPHPLPRQWFYGQTLVSNSGLRTRIIYL